MSKLPIELINSIMSYVSSPTADIFKKEIKEIKDEFDEFVEAKLSFARFYFFNINILPYGNKCREYVLTGDLYIIEYLNKYYSIIFGDYYRKPKYLL